MPKTPSSIVPLWLLQAKVSTPEAGGGQVPREALLRRLDALLECRFAALQAPAGFGKTTVLADYSRSKKAQGMVVAWVSLDEDDTPSVFGSYLAYAFEWAGLDLSLLSELRRLVVVSRDLPDRHACPGHRNARGALPAGARRGGPASSAKPSSCSSACWNTAPAICTSPSRFVAIRALTLPCRFSTGWALSWTWRSSGSRDPRSAISSAANCRGAK